MPVHPRVCGEQAPSAGATTPRTGPSPRVRGTVTAFGAEPKAVSVHPRVCGEQTAHHGITAHRGRSIPACAGNSQHELPGMENTIRSIPACAGNRTKFRTFLVRLIGPSPRVRGTVGQTPPLVEGVARSIPACAGNSGIAAHPGITSHRSIPACAGNSGFGGLRWWGRLGPSPRVRGTGIVYGPFAGAHSRSIPARAGNSAHRGYRPPMHQVHPRVCGEQAVVAASS